LPGGGSLHKLAAVGCRKERAITDRKFAVVTGASKGLGREIARQLAERGCLVWIGARDVRLGVEAVAALRVDGSDVRLLQLDVTDEISVSHAATAVADLTDRLDILVNNAEVALDAGVSPAELKVRTMQAIYNVNVFGPVRVTQAFLPLVKYAAAGRIVMVSSGLGSLTRLADPANPFFGTNLLGYNTSKTALNAVTLSFAKALSHTSIKVNAAGPGYMSADPNGYSGRRSVEQGAAIAVRLATLPDNGPTGGFFNDEGPEPW
jgi:NAD(P)-dependent dehydrogenase (short-subunit alcohol dehydrogenase family)